MKPEIQRTLDALEQQWQAEREERRGGGRGQRDERLLAVGQDAGRFLNTLARATGAKRALEVGGSMGYSAIWTGEAIQATGGKLTTLEAVPGKVAVLHARIAQAGLEDTVEVVAGDARQTLSSLAGPWDLVLVDAWKDDYPRYFDLIFPKLSIGGLMLADNITSPSPPGPGIDEYLRKARSHPNAQSQLVPLGNGLELTVRLR